jgi:tetratricopeptide (TPR) repeat protein
VTSARVWTFSLQRKFSEALQALQHFPEEVLKVYEGSVPIAFLEGVIYHHLGEKQKDQAAFEQARPLAERLVRESPEDAPRRATLGAVLAGLGQKGAAVAEVKRAVELLPESEDALGGPRITEALAQVYTWTGEYDQAFPLLDHLLAVPNGLSVPLLKLDPSWDPLRKDPRYEALIKKFGPPE